MQRAYPKKKAYRPGYKRFYSNALTTYPRRRYPQAYLPSQIGGYPGAPAVDIGRGFRGIYERSTSEKKYVDNKSFASPCDTTGLGTPLNLIEEVTGVVDRIGRKVCLKSFQVRGTFRPVDTGVNFTFARVMVVFDRQTNGALPTISAILQNATSLTFNNLNNRERFVTLMDKCFALGPYSTTATQTISPANGSFTFVNIFKRLPPNTETIFGGSGDTIADIMTGGLFLVTIGDMATGDSWVMQTATRVRFTDP